MRGGGKKYLTFKEIINPTLPSRHIPPPELTPCRAYLSIINKANYFGRNKDFLIQDVHHINLNSLIYFTCYKKRKFLRIFYILEFLKFII